MLRSLRTTVALSAPLVAALAVGLTGPTATALAPYQLAAATVDPCVSGGPTSADQAVATAANSRLTGSLRSAMTAYRASCLRAVVAAVQERGLPKRAAVIAITTTIVESTITNTNQELDHDSLGLFQQRESWGTASQRLNPAWATNAFLDKMIRVYPNGSWQTAGIGAVCQAVQVSAYPAKYQPEASDAQILVDAVWDEPAAAVAPAMAYDKGDGSMRIYRWGSTKSGFDRMSDYDSGAFALSNVDDRMASGDVNGDGKDDVVMAYQRADGTFGYYVWLNGNSAAQVWWTSGAFNLDQVGGRLVLDDFTGDGKAEPALAYDQGDGSMRIYRWTSTGTGFARTADYDSGAFSLANVGDRMASGDVNGDGKADIVMAYQQGDGTFGYYVWLNGNSSAQVYWSSGAFNLDKVAGRLVVDDFTGDGKAEPAVAYDQGDGTMRIYRWTSDGTGFNRTSDYDSGAFSLAAVGDRMAAGDVNADGKADIVMAYQRSDGTFAYYTWLNGNSAAQVWWTSGSYNLANVAGRLVLGNW